MTANYLHAVARRKSAGATSRPMWIGGYVALCAILVMRIPSIYNALRDQVPADLVAGVGDESMLTLALRVGVLLAFIVYPMVVAFVFWMAAAFERHLLPVALQLPWRQRVGLYYLTIMICTVPPQLFWILSGTVTPTRGLVYYTYLGTAMAVTFWLYRHGWRRLSAPRIILVIVTMLITGSLVATG